MHKHLFLIFFVLLLNQSVRGQNFQIGWSEGVGYKVTDINGIDFIQNPLTMGFPDDFIFIVNLEPPYSKSHVIVTEVNTNTVVEKNADGIYVYYVSQDTQIEITGIRLDKYTVDFNTLGGSPVTSLTDLLYEDMISRPETPLKPGLTFAGWYTDELFTNVWDFDLYKVVQDTTLYAKWTADVTFDSRGGTIVPSITEVPENQLITEPSAPVKQDEIFASWYTDTLFTNVWDFSSSKVIQDTTLYAKWVPDSYTVTLPAIGGVSYDTTRQVIVNYGDDFTFRPTVAANYTPITSVGASLGYQVKNNGDGSYTVENITDDISIYIYGVARLYTLTLGFEDQEVRSFVTCSPGPGLYEVTAGSRMQIMLYLDNAYEENDLCLLVNGDTIIADKRTKQSLNIAYSFNIRVNTDMSVKVICIQPEIPTGIHQPINDEMKVYTIPDHVIIERINSSYILQKEKVYIYTMSGQLEHIQSLRESTIRIPLPKGIYIVVIGKKHHKVIIR